MLDDHPKILTIGQVAQILSVSTLTLLIWDKAGILPAFVRIISPSDAATKKTSLPLCRLAPSPTK